MTTLITLLHVFSALNVVLLAGVGYVCGRNFLRFRSKHTLGLFVFAVLLLLENVLEMYMFVVDHTLHGWINDPSAVPPPAQKAMLVLRVIEFVAIACLSWITWD